MTDRQKVTLKLSPQAERYVRLDAPVEVRRMAAGGALPLPPVELATVLFALVHDPDDEVKARARDSLDALPDAMARSVLQSTDTNPAVLAYLTHAYKDDAGRMELVALNAALGDDCFAFLATLPHKRVADIVANNQERMLRAPEIVEALGSNPLTGRSTIDRILGFLGFERAAAAVAEGDGDMPPRDPAEITDAHAAAVLRDLLGEDASAFAEELIRDNDGEAPDEGSLYALVQNMTVMQKVKLARIGNKEARGLLIRDRNKIVASAVIRSPKITENEVEAIAKARNVSEEVLRIVAANREWTRNYQVKLGLSTNPKCPIPQALKFLNFLQEKDLRHIMKSKDVATPIATHARRMLQKKGRI